MISKLFNIRIIEKYEYLFVFFLLLSYQAYSQTTTTSINGTVKDSITGRALSYVTVRFDGTTIGDLSDNTGKYQLRNRQDKNIVVFSLMGYQTKTVSIPVGKNSGLNILLVPEGISLNEVIIRPGKEMYSKKNNPAVELVKKVIEHKEDYLITNQDYYSSEEYDRIFFAFNEFDPEHLAFKKFKFLSKYETKSRIDEKPILPFSVRETLSEVYYRKSTHDKRRIIKAHHIEGLDQEIDTEALNAIVKKTFTDIAITDNSINLLFQDFVGPLSTTKAVDFYKWYIIDTLTIDNRKFINLGFVPFNPRDIGFSGNLYVAADTTYALKRLRMRVPTKINVNFISSMVIEQEFKQLSPNLWIPSIFTTAMEFSLFDVLKFYVEKVKTYENFTFNQPTAVFLNPSPEVRLSDYDKHDKTYWEENRPKVFGEDYKMGEMMDDLSQDKFLHTSSKIAGIITSGYIATSANPEKNKVDLGTVETFYSYNKLEGNRLRLTAATTANFHKHLFLYGYSAYGFKDKKPKYMGEATWSFTRKEYHKDEFPVNNLSVFYKYDIAALGEQYLYAERDNILVSATTDSKLSKLTYSKIGQVSYKKEYLSGLSFNLYGTMRGQKAAMNILFESTPLDPLDSIQNLQTTEIGLTLKYAPNEQFFQRRRNRHSLPAKGFIYTLTYAKGFDNLLSGQYDYHKLSLSVNNELWIAPYGKLNTTIQVEKIWGRLPYPLLLTPNVNNSLFLHSGSFNLLKPLEFINDQQLSWNITYKMGGWFFNRVPLIRNFKWREVFEFRGYIGSLSKKNDPAKNSDYMSFPLDSYLMGNYPYMEFNVGIGNIFKFFRIDYIRRLNYLHHANTKKNAVGIKFTLNF